MAFRPTRRRGPRESEDGADLTGSVRLRRERAVRRQRLGLLVTLVVGALAVAATWAVAFSPLLATRTVDVRGTTLLTPAQVADAAQVPLGVPLLQQDRRAIATGVHSLAPVREVEVVRSWPHTLGIRVAERTPSVAFVVNGGFMLVDSQGVGYAQVPELPKDVLLARGDSSAPGITAAVGRTLGTLPADVRDQVRGVGADSPVKVSLDLDEKRVVVWGGPDDPELKARVLAVLLEQAPSATVYDVSAPAFPATR